MAWWLNNKRYSVAILSYRADIDGLRGVSILAVVFFHANSTWLSAGYLGVDVFFVISGYLITSILLTDMRQGKFEFAQFYERRIRRILPALVFMTSLSMVVAYFYLLPQDLVAFAKSVMAVCSLTSNFLFAGRLGYFDQAAHLEPLLHTWSLAVEEQFYLLFPLLLVLIWRTCRRYMAWLIALLALASLMLTFFYLEKNPNFAFFHLVTRAWELLAGALVAVYAARPSADFAKTIFHEFASLLGVTFILISFFVFEPNPKPWATHVVLPVAGACLLLSCPNGTMVSRLLSNRVLVFIGLISYSVYLWHQPIFAFARYLNFSEKSLLWPCLLLSTLLMGYVSYRYVEQPCRHKFHLPRYAVFIGALSALLFLAAMAAYIVQKRGFPERVPSGIEWRSLGEKLAVVGEVCTMKPTEAYAGVDICHFGQSGAKRFVALYGDSHAQAISYELDRQLKEMGLGGVWVRANGCHIVPDIVENGDVSQIPSCRLAFQELLRYLREQAVGVVVASRWTLRLFPVSGFIEELSFDNQEGGIEYNRHRTYAAVGVDGRVDSGAEAKRVALMMLLNSLDSVGKPTVLIYPIPELGWDIAKVNFHARAMLDSISTSKTLYEQRNAFVLDVFDHFQAHHLLRLRTADLYCDKTRCFGQRRGVPYYYDDDHLSTEGARLLVEKVMQVTGGWQ